VAALLVSSVPVIAAIGDPVLHGAVNTANKRTTLRGAADGDATLRVINRAPNGTGLEVVVEPGRPPFVVNTAAKVAKLNADRLDGKSIGAFMLKAKYDKDRDLVVDNAEKLDGLDSAELLTKTGAWSCPGNAWVAASTFVDYRTSGPLLSVGFGSASGFFRCAATLPDGVRVSSATFTVQDSSTIAGVECALFRTGLLVAIGATSELASGLITSGAPGATTLTTDQIELGLIDNSKYAYYAGCTVIEDGWDTGIYGVTISYKAPQVAADD
jgi:hypothetical protein